MSDAIFIVGYYRSGTSALSGALQRLGVKMFNEADPNEHNPLGFYEIPELIEFDVDVFNRLGVEWTDVRGLPEGWWERADMANYLGRLEAILRRRFVPGDAVWGLKHPHLCRLLPIYERATRQAGNQPHVVHIFREPWVSAASQQHKNGLSRAHALLLWMSYVTDAERHARHLPRSWVSYQDLLATPAAQLRRIEVEIGVKLHQMLPNGPREASSYLNTQLNRSEPLAREDLVRPLRELVARCWAAIQDRDFGAALWDGFAAETAGLVGFLTEIGSSRGRVIPAFSGAGMLAGPGPAVAPASLRPPERLDEGGKARLLALRDAAGELPRLAVVVVAPPGRAPEVSDTLESLRAQFYAPASIKIIASDALAVPEHVVVQAQAGPSEISRLLCAELNAAALEADYVAVLNAGDRISPDACLRFALVAEDAPEMIYCDEVVPGAGSNWVRHKPGWDVTRLSQSAYLGDWVWYRAGAVRLLGGFDAARAGAEEYDLQLRIAEGGGAVLRLAEALFTRSPASRRDDIPADLFCARAAEAVAAHLQRRGMPARVQNRQHLGLFHHLREQSDPGTSIILLVDGAEIGDLDRWMNALLGDAEPSGPIILAGAAPFAPVVKYLTAVIEQCETLQGKVLAVAPEAGMQPGQALGRALAMVSTELVAVLDARAQPATQHWASALRNRLADPGVAMVGARALVPMGGARKQCSVQGPIVIGADTRLGGGHLADDPGPGGWLIVDQEASAVAPPGLLARSALLAGCEFPPDLSGDALWIELGAQLRANGQRLAWTPDVSFIVPPAVIQPDTALSFRQGAAGGALPWADPYHHPALSLHGDLLAAELRLGLVRAAPHDPRSLLLSGPAEQALPVLNAARSLRHSGAMEADWVPEPVSVAELGRREPSSWVRVNPKDAPGPESPPYTAVFCAAPGPEAKPAIEAASRLCATSPGYVKQLRKLAGPGQLVALWRPSLSASVWEGFQVTGGLNTRPRVLWVDEGIAPGWFIELINETQSSLAWIAVERPGSTYSGAIARMALPGHERGWAAALGDLAPQIFVRPVASEVAVDHYVALMAAACGCHLLVDDRLDIPPSLGAMRLGNRLSDWQRGLQLAVRNLTATLVAGKQARAAALALPSTEAAPPLWAEFPPEGALLRRAAE